MVLRNEVMDKVVLLTLDWSIPRWVLIYHFFHISCNILLPFHILCLHIPHLFKQGLKASESQEIYVHVYKLIFTIFYLEEGTWEWDIQHPQAHEKARNDLLDHHNPRSIHNLAYKTCQDMACLQFETKILE